ncbi:MAG: ATP-binding protein [Chthoniobacteraceae bacterium]
MNPQHAKEPIVTGGRDDHFYEELTRTNNDLANLQHELARKNADLTREIAARVKAEAALEAAHRERLELSHHARMSEVAISVLHNVGNVLNSVGVARSMAEEMVRKMKIASVTMSAALLRDHAGDLADFLSRDPAGKQLPAYLSKVAESLLQKQAAALAELVEDAIRLGTAGFRGRLVREFAAVPPVPVERQRVLEILASLIRNARSALDENGCADPRLTFRIAPHGGGVSISIADNGIGVPTENFTRIFNQGFTTRKGAHGAGLHNGANAAKEMGGVLNAQSEGPGCGATFALQLPHPAAQSRVSSEVKSMAEIP